MSGRTKHHRFDIRALAVFTAVLTLGSLASRLVTGPLSVLVTAGVAIVAITVAVVVRTVRRDTALNALRATQWEATCRRKEAERRRAAAPALRRDAA